MKETLNYSRIRLPDGVTDAGMERMIAIQIHSLLSYNREQGIGLLGGVTTIRWEMDPATEHGVLLATWEKTKL